MLDVEASSNKGQAKISSILLMPVGLRVPAFTNLSGVKNVGSFQVVTTVAKFAALAFVSTKGCSTSSWQLHPADRERPRRDERDRQRQGIALFSYLGLETATVAANDARNPDRNIPQATLHGRVLDCGFILRAGRKAG